MTERGDAPNQQRKGQHKRSKKMLTYNDDTLNQEINNMLECDINDDLKVFNEEHGYNVGKYDSNFLDWLAMGIADRLEADGFVHEDCV